MHKFFLSLVAACTLIVAPVQAATELTVYTNIEPELLTRFSREFTDANPDITIKWVRDSAGPITARLIAEKDTPRADVIFGLSLAAVLSLEEYDMFSPYAPIGLAEANSKMRDMREPPVWTGMNAWGAALCINEPEMKKKGLPMPESWADLLKPEYKGSLVMASPVSSSSALSNISGWLQNMDSEEAAWEFMEGLHNNVKIYVHSGCKPCQMAAQGEIPIGIASDVCTRPLLERRAPLRIVTPKEGIGWDMEVATLVKKETTPEITEAAKKLVDFAASSAVAQIAIDNSYIPARSDALTDASKKIQAAFLPFDFAKAAANRDQIIKEWRNRFDRK